MHNALPKSELFYTICYNSSNGYKLLQEEEKFMSDKHFASTKLGNYRTKIVVLLAD